MAITGFPTYPRTFLIILSSGSKKPATVEIVIRITGSNAEKKLVQNPGNSLSFSGLLITNSCNGLALILLTALDSIGPDTIIAGIATIIPYINVLPISA
jgi:hypothetical protein